MNEFGSLGLGLLLFLSIVPQHESHPFFWFPPRTVQQPSTNYNSAAASSNVQPVQQDSNVAVSLGNRINTDTALDDYGTRVDGVTVNVKRRRRRRDIWDIASIASIPSSLNGSYIAIGDQVFQLPDQLSNVTLNVVSSSSPASASPQAPNFYTAFVPTIPENYTDAFRTLVTQLETLSLDTLDNIVQNLAVGYNGTFGQLFVESGFARLNQSLEYGRSVVNAGLYNFADQGAQGFEQLIRNFTASTSRIQRCVGNNLNPTRVARTVVGRANECVNAKWQELAGLVGNIGEDIVAADHGAIQFLANLTACNGANIYPPNGTIEETSTLRRHCYVKAVGSFPQALLFLPVSLTIDAAQLYASIQRLQTDVADCGIQLALEIGTVTAQISSRILLCQMIVY